MNAYTSAASNSPSTKPFVLSGDYKKDTEAVSNRAEAENKQHLAKWLKEGYQKCKSQLEPIKRQWYMNMAFYKGDQYVDFVDNRLIKIPAPNHRVRLVINRIKPVVRTEVSRLTSQKPTAEVVPASTEDRDVEAAKAAEAVFESLRERLDLQRVIRQACWWASVTGTGFIKTYWDPDYTDTDVNDMAVNGDHCYNSLSPFHVLIPDLLEEDIEKQPYVLNVFTKSLEWVAVHYPDLTKDDKFKPTVISSNEIMESQYLNLKGAEANKAKPDSCLVIEAWIKPDCCTYAPKGGRVVMIDDFIVDCDLNGLPYEHGEYPFAKIESVQSGSFYASSVIEDLIPIQREINRTRSQLIEARNLMAKPGWFYTEGSIDPNKWTSNMAQFIGVKPGMQMPTPTPLPQMPNYVPQLEAGFLAEMEDISGQHQVSKGSAPPGVTAGTAIQFLQESDNSYLATTHSSVEDAIKKVAKHSIALAIQYWDSDRLVKYVGRNRQVSAKYLQASDIKGGTDVRIEGGSSLPQSKAARIAMFTDFMARGIIQVDQGLKLMGLPSMQAYWDIADVDENQAVRENIAMSELDPEKTLQARTEVSEKVQAMIMQQTGGDPMLSDPNMNPMLAPLQKLAEEPVVEVHEWDNHAAHKEFHTRFMKGQEYESYPDEIKNEYELHLRKHEDFLMQQMFQDMAQQVQQGGEQAGGPAPESGNNQFSDLNKPVDTEQPPQ